MSRINALLLTALCLSVEDSRASTPADVFRKVQGQIVTIELLDRSRRPLRFGSGVIVARGMIATNCHVIEAIVGSHVVVKQRNRIFDASVQVQDQAIDVCILKADAIDSKPVEFGSTRDLAIGSHVYAVGAPEGYDLSLSDGIVSAMRNLNGIRYIQTTAPISSGSSGGGLFDSDGRLVGLT